MFGFLGSVEIYKDQSRMLGEEKDLWRVVKVFVLLTRGGSANRKWATMLLLFLSPSLEKALEHFHRSEIFPLASLFFFLASLPKIAHTTPLCYSCIQILQLPCSVHIDRFIYRK